MSRAVRNAADCHNRELEAGGNRYQTLFVTLTYAQPDAWSGRHVSTCLHHIRRWLERQGHSLVYEWVAEIQTRRLEKYGDAVVHYHLIIWLPRHLTLPKLDKRGWWPHGITQVARARNPVGYVSKYASKLETSENFPRGLRLHGRGGMSCETRRKVRWWVAPRYVREAFGDAADPVRARGGGWLDRTTGEWIEAMSLNVALQGFIPKPVPH